jgi:hypothetical protein
LNEVLKFENINKLGYFRNVKPNFLW